MTEQWQELKETIIEMRDNDGTLTQQKTCKFLANYMEVLEKQMQEPCEDCISRQKALDCFEQTNTRQGAKYAIETLPSVTPQQTRWIPVSERLPERSGDYLVTTKWKGSYSGDVYIETNMAVYKKKQEEWDCVDVIAWMPLPEPYKAESEE